MKIRVSSAVKLVAVAKSGSMFDKLEILLIIFSYGTLGADKVLQKIRHRKQILRKSYRVKMVYYAYTLLLEHVPQFRNLDFSGIGTYCYEFSKLSIFPSKLLSVPYVTRRTDRVNISIVAGACYSVSSFSSKIMLNTKQLRFTCGLEKLFWKLNVISS